MAETYLLLLKIFVVLATAGSLLELGLQLELRQTVAGVRNPRFALLTLLWGFALGPALAVLLARVLFLAEPRLTCPYWSVGRVAIWATRRVPCC
jgi:BASS family bile acid:Na+ symporter